MGPRRRIVGCPQGLVRIKLLAVVHAAGCKRLSSPDIVTRAYPLTLAATEDDECSEGNVPETHDGDSNDEADGETVVLTICVRLEVGFHIVVTDGVVAFDGRGWIRAGSGRGRPLKLFSGLTVTVDATAFGAFFDGEGNIVGDLYNKRVR